MRNLLASLACGLVVFALLFAPRWLSAGEASVPAVIAVLAVYFVLARRSFRRIETLFMDASKHLQTPPPRFDLAIEAMQKGYPIAKEQFGIRTQIDAQIGVIYFLQQEVNKALPYLKRSLTFGHWMAGAMLGVCYYKKKDYENMRKVFTVLQKRSAKQGIVWCLYAYLLSQIGDHTAAQAVLTQGVSKAKDDPRVAEALLAVQNGKKIKMKAYQDQWYQFHLERPPAEYYRSPFPQQQKVSRAARRGRWS
jgi:hypothetical protein